MINSTLYIPGRTRWHCLVVAPQREAHCKTQLALFGISAFYPVKRHVTNTRGRPVVREIKYLPRYIFAAVPGLIMWHRLRERIPSIRDAVRMSSGELAILEPSDLRGLQRMAAIDQEREDRRIAALRIKSGDTVRLTGGAFEGQTVEVWDVGPGHAKFRIRMFGGEIDATAPLSQMQRQQPVAPGNNIG